MSIRRLDLPDGQWADLLEKPRHAEYVAIIAAAERAQAGRGTFVEWAETCGREYLVAWSVRGEDGQALAVDDWGPADPDITDAICAEAQRRWREWQQRRRPFVTTPPSSDDTSPDSPSP